MKTSIKILSIACILLASSAYAAEKFIVLEDNKPILGKWNIHHEAAALHKEKVPINNDWTFGKDGMITAISRDRRMGSDQGIKIKYSIADGVIKKQFTPGREKYEDCKVVKLEGREMILHCKFNYFFMTRI
ncbi:MAG: hypothetical protein HFP78_02900 [Methylococcales symbiont of Hymedesmia sp. n. MRB-2018]|nr:MAG: hypothetical protein HFP78_02900 [Methylococcales symbiont of Hymedesmia sp. n. MRB-2018]